MWKRKSSWPANPKRLDMARTAFVILLALLLCGQVFSQSTVTSGKAHIVYVAGKVSVQKGGTSAWKPAALKAVLVSGDHVKTGPGSRAVLSLEDRSTLKLNANTHLLLTKIQPMNQSEGTKIQLFVGNVWTDVNNFFYQKSSFEVESGQTTASVRGTAFDLECRDGAVVLKEWEGTVRLRTGTALVDVESFEEAEVRTGGVRKRVFPSAEEAFNDWNAWNNYIDGMVSELPQEAADIDTLADELDALPEIENFAAALGALLESMPEMRGKVKSRLARRIPPGLRNSEQFEDLERVLAGKWRALDGELKQKIRGRLEVTERKMRSLRERLKRLPGRIRVVPPDVAAGEGGADGSGEPDEGMESGSPQPGGDEAHPSGGGGPAQSGAIEIPKGYRPLSGTVMTSEKGNFFVPEGENLTVLGSVKGNLIIPRRSSVSINGMLTGNITNFGTLTVLGTVRGDVYDKGGSLQVLGRVEGTIHREQ
jgi:hypothetical protein